jgi:chromosome segregation ATPase
VLQYWHEPKYVTIPIFEKSMALIARSFSKIDERFDKIDERFSKIDERFDRQEGAFTSILKQMQIYAEEAREHRQTMSSLVHTDVKQEREVEDLKIRVERLEMRIK